LEWDQGTRIKSQIVNLNYYFFFCFLIRTTAYFNVTVSNPTNPTSAISNTTGIPSPVSTLM